MREGHATIRGRDIRKDRESGALPRRRLLGGSLVLALAACEPLGRASGRPDGDPGLAAVRRALRGEERMIAEYETVRIQYPELASRIGPVVQEHRAHLRMLRAQISPSPSPAESSTPSSPVSTSASARPAPSDPAGAISALVERERAAADARIRDLEAAPPFVAQLLASISASEATHAAVLARTG